MKTRSPSGIFVLLVLMFTLFVSQACSRTDQEAELNLQSTLVAIELTKISLESQATPMPAQPIEQDEADIQPPVVEPPPQPVQEPNVSYEGISFSFSPAIAESANGQMILEQIPEEYGYASDVYPAHYNFTLSGYPIGEHQFRPVVFVYPVEDYRSISEHADNVFNLLGETLANRPGGTTAWDSPMPFLPLWPLMQAFTAQVAYFDFHSGTGVRYLTYKTQDIFPVDNKTLTYTYQGITHNGRYYVSAVFPITHSALYDDAYDLVNDETFNFDEFYNNWERYLSQITDFLEEQQLDSFTPSIHSLDGLVKSISIDR